MTTNIQIIPTLYCNMSCDGCYLSANHHKKFINIENYNLIADFIINYNIDYLKTTNEERKQNPIEISLLGGEITTVYSCKDILEIKNILEKKLKIYFNNIVFGIQTNLIMKKNKLDCLLKNGVKVGTSFNFDNTRKYKHSVYDYYKTFFNNYNYIIKHYSKKLGIIIVINKNNINYIFDITKKLLKDNFYFVLSPFEALGYGIENNLSVENNELINLYVNLYEFIYKNNIYTDIQPLKNYLLIMYNNTYANHICGFENYCHKKALSFYYNENVYVCPEFQSTLLSNTEIGNWKTGKIYEKNIKNTIYKSYILPEKCKTCKYLKHCYGMCPAKRLLRNGNTPYYCDTYYQIFDYLNDIKNNNVQKFNKLLDLFSIKN